MKLRLISDIHLEFDNRFILKEQPDDKDTILIIAGDLAEDSSTIMNFLEDWAKRFRKIIYVFGNHEYYGYRNILNIDGKRNPIQHLREQIKNKRLDNVRILEKELVEIDGIKIVGATLWSALKDPLSKIEVAKRITDYHLIKIEDKFKINEHRIIPDHTIAEHTKTMKYFNKVVDENTIVVTHFMPSFQCVDPRFKDSDLNDYFTSDLDTFIIEKKPKLWLYGHSHYSGEISIGSTRLLINAKGYGRAQNMNFNNDLVIEV